MITESVSERIVPGDGATYCSPRVAAVGGAHNPAHTHSLARTVPTHTRSREVRECNASVANTDSHTHTHELGTLPPLHSLEDKTASLRARRHARAHPRGKSTEGQLATGMLLAAHTSGHTHARPLVRSPQTSVQRRLRVLKEGVH